MNVAHLIAPTVLDSGGTTKRSPEKEAKLILSRQLGNAKLYTVKEGKG